MTLAATQLLWLLVEMVVQLQHGRRFFDPAGHIALAQSVFSFDHTKAEREVVSHRHVRVECIGLEHHPQTTGTCGKVIHGNPVDADLSVRDLLKSRQHAKRG